MIPGDRQVVVDSLGVGIATGAYGVSFGAVAAASGLDVWQACALSLLVFTGASQFAFVGVVAAGGAPLAGSLTALLLGSRNTFYGLALAPHLEVRGWRRLLTAQLIIDESTAMGLGQDDARRTRLAFRLTGVTIFVLWNLATLAGAAAGQALGDPRAYGLDAAVGAAFLGLLWPRLTAWPQRVVAVVGAGAAMGLVPWTPAGVPVILGGAAAVAAGLVLARRRAAVQP
ncbi:AzlC family ABC transporter permease [Nocardioides humilatus]|uniref:AzlC family ABC transporter permease n=1 Tax=Nocardioides humilatus TaxID=2607660 RepID=A0A5B1LG19_9ACTN|nr:AzlC family ABC transporter permease [Nocardioides humilatus]KAA1418730.1 AzlC family ABC transporter permease [Nocardioides humilatus]